MHKDSQTEKERKRDYTSNTYVTVHVGSHLCVCVCMYKCMCMRTLHVCWYICDYILVLNLAQSRNLASWVLDHVHTCMTIFACIYMHIT